MIMMDDDMESCVNDDGIVFSFGHTTNENSMEMDQLLTNPFSSGLQAKRIPAVPSLVFTSLRSTSSSTSSSGSVGEDLRTPGVLHSAASSPVFNLMDEDSRDSGYGGGGEGASPKRRKTSFTSLRVPLKVLNRCHSENDALGLHKDERLIGDESMPHALPIMDRPHVHDLKCISSETLRRLISGGYDDLVQGYTLIDCRYPYEYEGGHIKGAINIYTQEELMKCMMNESIKTSQSRGHSNEAKRQIFVFYCEFSRERGPKMNRYLRECDRRENALNYPKLFYPEIYLLDGGYKNFYSNCSDLCEPQTYRPMHDENHLVELRKFRSKSKSWCTSSGAGGGGDTNVSVNNLPRRPGLNRLNRELFNSKGHYY